MRSCKQTILAVLILALSSPALPVWAQRPYRANDRQVERTLTRIETRTNTFRDSLAAALDRSRLDGSSTEDSINTYVSDFENATRQLRDHFRDRRAVSSDVQEVLNRAAYIDQFMRQQQMQPRAERDWNLLRTDLEQLAQYYNVAWNWNTRPGYNTGGHYESNAGNNSGGSYGNNNGGYSGSQANNGTLTGTYRLDSSRSESAHSVAERATRSLPAADRERVREMLIRRLNAPETIAIDQRGRTFTVASTLAPQISFEADGRDQTEYMGGNRRVNVRASMSGSQLIVSTTGDRGNDFQVTFEPQNFRRELRVTRRVYVDAMSQPVVAISRYTRTADVAQWDIYRGDQTAYNGGYDNGRSNNGSYNGTVSGRARGSFYIPNGTALIATLNDNLSTETSHEGDRFTMTVRSPNEYAGAIIEGTLSNVGRAGRVTGQSELSLNFERIRLANGQTHDFMGYIEDVRTPSGEKVSVNNEGTVKDNDNQTNKTVMRGGIGAALGAVIGAIAGGGKGAAIGAAIGAGAGAGSVYIQGRDDLELRNGTEFTIRTSAPNR